jgi:hypothetical protein
MKKELLRMNSYYKELQLMHDIHSELIGWLRIVNYDEDMDLLKPLIEYREKSQIFLDKCDN